MAREKRAAYASEEYWGRPVAGFGDPHARIAILGLAPAAHGANRTGRVFTGDRSGDFLFAALWRAGLASQPASTARDDGLRLSDVWITAAVRCAPPENRPTPAERERCLPYTRRVPGEGAEAEDDPEVGEQGELAARVGEALLALGAFAWDAALRLEPRRPRPRPKFTHGGERSEQDVALLASFHCSQQNTFTGRLTEAMFDAVLVRAIELAAR